jgi:hypothetical protein
MTIWGRLDSLLTRDADCAKHRLPHGLCGRNSRLSEQAGSTMCAMWTSIRPTAGAKAPIAEGLRRFALPAGIAAAADQQVLGVLFCGLNHDRGYCPVAGSKGGLAM